MEISAKGVKDSSGLYEVERRARHAERPGFRISELQISSTQQVPWHYHSNIQDTFYVLVAPSGSSCAIRKKKSGSAPVRPMPCVQVARTWSPMGAKARRPSWCSRESASTTTYR